MLYLKGTKDSDTKLVAGFGVPALTQAIWDRRKKEADPAHPVTHERRAPTVQTECGPGKALLESGVLSILERFPSNRIGLLTVWGAALVVVLSFVFISMGGKGGPRAAHAQARPATAVAANHVEGPALSGIEPGKASGPSPSSVVRKDPLLEVLETLKSDDFDHPEALSTGRFLEEVSKKARFLKGIDLETIQVVARAIGWVRLEARYRPSKLWFEKEEEEETLILDLVQEESEWKLENLRVTRRSQPPVSTPKPMNQRR